MSLPLLPTELNLNIVEHLDPGSAFHFALSSKAQFQLCKDKLQQHAKLFAKYSVIRPSSEGHLIWDVTKEILQDPQKGWYVRDLHCTSKRPSEYRNMPVEDISLFKVAAEKILPLYPYEPGFFASERSDTQELNDEMDDDIDRGFEGSVLVLLVHHLPRLRTFRMTENCMSDTFQSFMRRVAVGYQNPSIALRMPLQHLRLAAIAHYDTENSCSVYWAVYFLCIPSLKTFAAFMMGSEDVDEYGENSETYLRNTANAPVSNVEELYFQCCQFDPGSFNTLLPMVKDLKRFHYDAGGHTVAQQDYEPRKVMRALVNHAGHSLEELDLAETTIGFDDGEEDIRSVSARGFKKLKALHCESRWLLRNPEDSWADVDSENGGESCEDLYFVGDPVEEPIVYSKDPRDNLPESLEYLYLDGVYENDEWKEMVEIFETTNANTPKLTLENTCINRDDEEKRGNAVEPHIRFANKLLEGIWKGHNHFL